MFDHIDKVLETVSSIVFTIVIIGCAGAGVGLMIGAETFIIGLLLFLACAAAAFPLAWLTALPWAIAAKWMTSIYGTIEVNKQILSGVK